MMQTLNYKCLCVRAHSMLKSLTPVIHEICVLDLQLPKDQQNPIFHQFYNTLIRGAKLVKECVHINPFNLLLRYKCATQIIDLEKKINHFMQLMPAHTLLDARKLITAVSQIYEHADIGSSLNQTILEKASMLTNDPSQNSVMLRQIVSGDLSDSPEKVEDCSLYYSRCNSFPGKSRLYVGLEKTIASLKELLFQTDASIVGVHCIGGGGKTTLALALCNGAQVKGYFGSRVLFLTVSQSPNLKGILETMWEKILGGKRPKFQNVEDARIQLQLQLMRQSKPTLVILDDVWSRSNLEKLLFEGPAYKTLVTTRDSSIIPRNPSTRLYQLPLLDQKDSLSLFCFWAFGQKSIPDSADEDLVKEVQAECRGLPLALKVIASSLYGEPPVAWQSARNKLSKGEPISDYHKEGLFRCSEASIDCLDDVTKQCFLDLASFPEDRQISADTILDIWVYVRKLEWQDAFIILFELASRNLLNLTSNSGNLGAVAYGNASELFFSQHDVIRDLAFYLGCQDSLIHRKRIIMLRKEHCLPGKWELLKDRAFDAQIVSIHTGPVDESQWVEMNLPETEALVLIFSASEYSLPCFVSAMKKLKYLMVYNYGSKRATVKGFDSLSSLTQLQCVRLEKVIATPVLHLSKPLQKLEKLSSSLCQGFEDIPAFNNNKLPIMKYFNLEYCDDLEELSPSLFHMPCARMWSITNCHQLGKLPYDIDNLSSVKVLRLSALPGLKELPASIGKLEQLEYLDISQCECLRELPEKIGQLKKLKKIDMRECSRLTKLSPSICGLTSLKRVICDEKIGKQWLRAKEISIPDLRVEIVESQFSLDWLDY